MNAPSAAAAAVTASSSSVPSWASPLKRARIDETGAQTAAQQPLPPSPPPAHADLLAAAASRPHSSVPFEAAAASGFGSFATAAAAAAAHHSPFLPPSSLHPPVGKKRLRSEGEGDVEALLIQLRVDNEQQHAAAQQWAGASAAGHAIAAVSSPANASMCTDPTPSPICSGAVLQARFPSPLPAQLAELQEEDEYGYEYEDENGPRDTSRPTPARSVSMERMQSFSRFQPPPTAAAAVGAGMGLGRGQASAPPSASSTAFLSVAIPALPSTSPIASPSHQLVDPVVLAHLAQHLPVLPSTMPGLSAEVLALMLLSKMELESLPQGVALTQEQFLQGLRGIGCDSDQRLQLLLQNMLVEFLPPPPAPGGSNGATAGASAPSSSSSSSSASALQPQVSPAFKSFFLHCFALLRRLCGPPTKKALDLATTRRFLGLLLGERYPQHMFPFLSFLDELVRAAEGGAGSGPGAGPAGGRGTPNATLFSAQLEAHRYSFDKWSCTLEWCLSIHPHTLAGYDEEGSWPVLFDDFATWLCQRAPAVREASAKEAAAMQQKRALEERRRAELQAASSRRAASDAFISDVLAEQSAAASRSAASGSHSIGSLRGGTGVALGFGRIDGVQPLDADLDGAPSLTDELTGGVTAIAGFQMHSQNHLPLRLQGPASEVGLNPYEHVHRLQQQQQQQTIQQHQTIMQQHQHDQQQRQQNAFLHSPATVLAAPVRTESHNMCDQE